MGESESVLDRVNDLLDEVNPDQEERLKYQEEDLKETTCIDPRFPALYEGEGKSVDTLLSTLELTDQQLEVEGSAYAKLGPEVRQKVRVAIIRHLERCAHCARERGYAIEFDARLCKTYREKPEDLMALIEEGL